MASRSAPRLQPHAGKGVLSVPVSATRKPTTSSKAHQRSSMSRLRLIVRRLPPGLTEAEFWAAIGEDWAVGQGKVDWAAYKDGKVSKEYVRLDINYMYALTICQSLQTFSTSPRIPTSQGRVLSRPAFSQSQTNHLSGRKAYHERFMSDRTTLTRICAIHPNTREQTEGRRTARDDRPGPRIYRFPTELDRPNYESSRQWR